MKINKMHFSLLLLVFSFCLMADEKAVPVQYGGEEELDACSAYAEVKFKGKDPDEFLAVKTAPDLKSTRIAKLKRGQRLWICEERKSWFGVVYTLDDKIECGVSGPVKIKKPYAGPCQSGWVSDKYVEILAD